MSNFNDVRFKDAQFTAELTANIENLVIGSLTGADASVIDFVSVIIAENYVFQVAKIEKIAEIWNTGRNRNQEITDWILDTYYTVAKTVGGGVMVDKALELYAEASTFNHGDELSVIDDDLGARMESKVELEKVLKANQWFIVIFALFAIDIKALGAINEADNSGTSN